MTYQALQDETELARFLEILRAEGVRSYLEIGAKFGGALWRAANVMPAGSRIVAVDLPGGTRAWPESGRSLERCIAELGERYDAHLIWGDSTAPVVIAAVRALGPFDACLIDANHTLPYITKDFANYSPLCRIVALHDIAWRRPPEWRGVRIDVPAFWRDIKRGRRFEEISHCDGDNGIGVLWRC